MDAAESIEPASLPGLDVSNSAVERCLGDIRADFERQGGLSMDDVYRLISGHRLEPDDAALVLTRLDQLGLDIEAEDERIDSDDESAIGLGGAQLGAHRILTAVEEVNLGRRIHLGLAAIEALDGREPTDGEAELIRDGREAHQLLVRSNVRLVMFMARRYAGQGLEMDDIIQEGVLGLMRAADKFDHTLGYKFSTYATWWIRQSIDRAMANSSRTIRLPVHIVEQVERVRRVRTRMESLLGRPPSLAELSFELQMDIAKISALLDYSRGVVSLDLLVGEDVTLGDLQIGPGISPHLTVEHELLRQDVASRLDWVGYAKGDRAADVLRMRFGFTADGEPHTLDEIGKVHGVSRERIRQIEKELLMSDFVKDLFSDLSEGWFSDDSDGA